MNLGNHPQIDGQTEVLKKKLETYLRCFTSKQQHQWEKWLPLLNGGTILPTILHLKWLHMKLFMGSHPQCSFHTPPIVHHFRQLTWFCATVIIFFTWKEITWSSKPINTILSAPFKSMIWFFFVCSLTSNPPWNSKGIRSWLQISMVHIRFFKILGMLLINWNFLLLTAT